MSGYKERTIRLEFPELADDCFVVIKNPLLLPDTPDDWAKLEPNDRLRRDIARLVVTWNVWNPEAEGDVPLPVPTAADPSSLLLVPRPILKRLIEERARPFEKSMATPPNGAAPMPPMLTEAGISPTS